MTTKKQETGFQLSETPRQIPKQETLAFRMSSYCAVMERDPIMFYTSLATGIGYKTLDNMFFRKRASVGIDGEILRHMADFTKTDLRDWLDAKLFLTVQNGRYAFLPAEEIVSSAQSTEAAEAEEA